jgi:hypothetical protein
LCVGDDNYDTGIQEYRKYKDDLSFSSQLFSMCGGDDIKIQEYRKCKDDLSCNTGSTKTTCPAVLFYSLCGVAMIIMIQEYRNTESTKTTCPVVLSYSLCLVVMIIKIQEYRKYKGDLSLVLSYSICVVVKIMMMQEYRNTENTKTTCPTVIFYSLCGGDDNYDTGIQEKRNTGSTKTTYHVVLFYSLCVVVMIIMMQEYRNTGKQEVQKRPVM